MTNRASAGKWLALLLTSLILGFAPLFHAVCIGATAAHGSSHTMADGTVMSITSHSPNDLSMSHQAPTLYEPTLQTLTLQTPTLQAPLTKAFGSSLSSLSQNLLLLVPALVILLGFWFARHRASGPYRKCQQTLFRGLHPPAVLHRPTMVDLMSLGISRT
jgi:hypothetical protein